MNDNIENEYLSLDYINCLYSTIISIAKPNQYNEYTFSDNSFICFDFWLKTRDANGRLVDSAIVQAFSPDGKLLKEQSFDKEREENIKKKLA